MRLRLLAGGEGRYRFDPEANPEAKGLLPVFDVEKGARRFVNLDGVRTVGPAQEALVQ